MSFFFCKHTLLLNEYAPILWGMQGYEQRKTKIQYLSKRFVPIASIKIMQGDFSFVSWKAVLLHLQ